MILIAFLLIVVGMAIGLARAARHRSASASDVRTAAVAGAIIAAVRLSMFWMALALLQRPDWRQVAGYALLLFSAVVELVMVSWARSLSSWALMASVLIVMTSFVLGWAWAWLASPKGTARNAWQMSSSSAEDAWARAWLITLPAAA